MWSLIIINEWMMRVCWWWYWWDKQDSHHIIHSENKNRLIDISFVLFLKITVHFINCIHHHHYYQQKTTTTTTNQSSTTKTTSLYFQNLYQNSIFLGFFLGISSVIWHECFVDISNGRAKKWRKKKFVWNQIKFRVLFFRYEEDDDDDVPIIWSSSYLLFIFVWFFLFMQILLIDW